jgi:hypothetical protein
MTHTLILAGASVVLGTSAVLASMIPAAGSFTGSAADAQDGLRTSAPIPGITDNGRLALKWFTC